MRFGNKYVFVLAAMLTFGLAGCQTEGPGPVLDLSLAPVPTDLIKCFNDKVPRPKGVLTKKVLAKLVADLKGSEEAKSYCGKRLIAFYDAQDPALRGDAK